MVNTEIVIAALELTLVAAFLSMFIIAVTSLITIGKKVERIKK